MSSKRAVWMQRIEAWQASGESAAAFCRSQGLSYAQGTYWQRALRRSEPEREVAPVLVPVRVESPPGPSRAPIELVLPSGMRLQGFAGFAVTEVVALVRGLSC